MKRNKVIRRCGLVLATGIGWVLLWYGQSRLLAPGRAVRLRATDYVAAPAREDGSLRVAAYNIAHGRGAIAGASNWTGASREDIEAHLSAIARQVEDVDILVLNEVDFDCTWSQRINQARLIAERAGFGYYAEQRNIDVSLPFRRYRFGNAVLSRYPITDVHAVYLPPLSRREKVLAGNHDALLADIESPLGALRILAVHLEYRSEEIRVQCARIIRTLVADSPVPFVAMGDFNTAPRFAAGHRRSERDENAMDLLLEDGLLSVGSEPLDWTQYLTFPSLAPDRAIDWILISPELQLGELRVVSSTLSDHRMVTAELHVTKP